MTARIALLGALGYGTIYSRLLLENQEADGLGQLVGAIDPRHEAVPDDHLLRTHRIPLYASLDDFLAADRADLFIIATPIHTHLPLTRACLASGADVLLEKPLCGDLAQARELLALTDAGPGRVHMGYQRSYSPGMQALKQAIQAGELGTPAHFSVTACWPRDRAYYDRAAWAGRQRLEDGTPVFDSPMNNACAHFLFNMLWLLDPELGDAAAPTRLRAALGRANAIENCDTCLVELVAAGVSCRFQASHAIQREHHPDLCYRFSDGVLRHHWQGEMVFTRPDGSTRTFAPPEQKARKVAAALRARQEGRSGPCSVRAAAMHTIAIST
ncbi:MAG: Gfo/Idh/MocA family protein, partial [Planctomycetota bacterium]